MDVKEFNVEFKYLGKKYVCAGTKFKPSNEAMYRVVVPFPKKEYDAVIILYEVNLPKQRFFWYKESVETDHLSEKIAKALEKTDYS